MSTTPEIVALEKIEHWIFDLDGTIADSKMAIINSASACYQEFEIPPKPANEIASLIGRPGLDLFLNPEVALEVSNRALQWFRSHLKENGKNLTSAFDGAKNLLESLKSRGIEVSLATNKSSDLAEQVLKDLDLGKYFGFISGTDACKPKPAPDVVMACLNNYKNALTVMIGDTPDDVLAGKAAGVTTVAVNHGTRPIEELVSANPDYLVNSLSELIPLDEVK